MKERDRGHQRHLRLGRWPLEGERADATGAEGACVGEGREREKGKDCLSTMETREDGCPGYRPRRKGGGQWGGRAGEWLRRARLSVAGVPECSPRPKCSPCAPGRVGGARVFPLPRQLGAAFFGASSPHLALPCLGIWVARRRAEQSRLSHQGLQPQTSVGMSALQTASVRRYHGAKAVLLD